MDMNPWDNIMICGNSSNKVSDLNNLGANLSINEVRDDIKENILRNF
jgi:lipoate-protein ligase B